MNSISQYNVKNDQSQNNSFFIPDSLSSEIHENIICGIYAEQRFESELPLEVSCAFFNRDPEKESQLSSNLMGLIEKNIIQHPFLKIRVTFYILCNKESDFSDCINLYTAAVLRSGIGVRNMIFSVYRDGIHVCAASNKIIHLVVNKKVGKDVLRSELEAILKDVVALENRFKEEFMRLILK